MPLTRVLTLLDLPFLTDAQEGNPSGSTPPVKATGSIGNMQYEAATAGAAGNLITIMHQLAQFYVPSRPLPPTGGTMHTVGAGGDFATLSAAIADPSVASGDKLKLIGASITEAALVTVDKTLEIYSEVNTVLQRDSTNAVLKITAGSVYIHDFTITNNQQANLDAGGQSCCINADTMNRNAYSGVSGVYIENMTFNHPKVGVFMSGDGWVINNCTFNVNAASQTAGTTLRPIFLYGTVNECFIENNTINTSLDSSRTIGIFFDSRNDGIAPAYASGYQGAVVVQNNTIVKNGANGAPRSYMDLTGFYRQSGPASTNGNLGEFSLYIVGNNFGTDYASSPCVFFGRTGVLPFSFFNILLVQNNTFGKRTTGAEKGVLFFTSASALASRSMGTFADNVYASNNTITAATLASPNISIMDVAPTLLMVRDNTYYDAPSPLITPAAPVGAFQVTVIDNFVTIKVPPSTPATSLEASLDADATFSNLVSATAADGNNASTTGITTLSGGVG